MDKAQNMVAIPPGATIREHLVLRGITQEDFARDLGVSEEYISQLLEGNVELTPDIALRSEHVFGISANFWINLETIYRNKL